MTMTSGYVYWIRSGDQGPVRIGWSWVPQQRLRQLQYGNPEELHLLAQVPGTQQDEKALHMELASFLIRKDWFRPVPAVLQTIGRFAQRTDRTTAWLRKQQAIYPQVHDDLQHAIYLVQG